jgi:8-oxo-dGTP pyrophosphatase MutT (NUDIX family)
MDDAPQRYAPGDHLDSRTLLVAAAYVVLCRAGSESHEVLLQLRQGTGYMDGHWATLAGHVDPGESVHEAAVREAAEEAGIEIDPADLVPLTVLHRFERGGPAVEQRVDVFFSTTRWRGVPTVRELDKAAAMGWFPIDELPEPVVPHERLVLDTLASGSPMPAVLSLPA